jgi:enoyl-CoA hydratase
VERNDQVLSVTIDRPETRNAVDLITLQQIERVMSDAGDARVIVLSGAPPAFCSGADLGGVELGEFTETLLRVLKSFGSSSAITIAAVDGAALGAGTQLAAACDLRMATAESRFGVPAAKLGLAVDRWTVARTMIEAGGAVARRMLLTGEAMTGAELVGGFVHRLGTVDEAHEWARSLSDLAPLTVRAHKLALESLMGAGSSSEASAVEIEVARLAAWGSRDADEGRRAFKEKRAPRFLGL